jgi:hypothetical protein
MTVDLEAELATLRKLSRQQLKERWRNLYRVTPPTAFTPDLLARGIAWRLQERALGGPSEEVRRLIGAVDGGGKKTRKPFATLKQGNRLVRRWRGRTYVVEAKVDGFSYDGEQYRSLSEIARLITGTRWSGPKFFGLAA